jgi:hypothetical protein
VRSLVAEECVQNYESKLTVEVVSNLLNDSSSVSRRCIIRLDQIEEDERPGM